MKFPIGSKVIYEGQVWKVIGYKLDPNFRVIKKKKREEVVHISYLHVEL